MTNSLKQAPLNNTGYTPIWRAFGHSQAQALQMHNHDEYYADIFEIVGYGF